uniref:Uncharacterized protein n=1 Tax=Tanacetum cinerariifolium TaxID=118510 RepID=A0A6L2N465_TANCI|nr:hypothetical protein [Tanacetum cinerariifolium]
MEEEEEDEMEIEEEMNDHEIINPYKIEEGTTYVGSGSSLKVFAPGPMGKDVDIFHHKVKSLAQQMFERANTEYSTLKRLKVSTLEDQMRGLMLEDKEEKQRLKKKLKVSQKEKEQMDQAFRHVVYWIHKHFGVEIPPCMDDGDRVNAALEAERASQANAGGKEAMQMELEAKKGHLQFANVLSRVL